MGGREADIERQMSSVVKMNRIAKQLCPTLPDEPVRQMAREAEEALRTAPASSPIQELRPLVSSLHPVGRKKSVS